MAVKVAINGFGRIGRMVYRRALEVGDIDVVAVNGTADVETCLHLLKYDSIHGTWRVPMKSLPDGFEVAGQQTRYFSTRDPANLPWGDLDVDVVIEATGKFRTRETMQVHMNQGAKRVVLTAPAKTAADADVTLVMGVNEHMYNPSLHRIISAASCTTNCLAPVVKVLHETFGINHGLMTTVHSFTNDQNSLDNPHKDLRRARACGESLIPTSTGAAKAMGLVLPDLAGKLNGVSIRVPTPNVSMVDLVAELSQPVTADAVNLALFEAANGPMYGTLGYTEEPLVSVDFYGDSHSAVVDGLSTMVISEQTVKVLAWYDNEWGYSCRVVDIARLIGGVAADSEGTVQEFYPKVQSMA
ncbi:type I glyceraldehyde-3-phosphate dehydrogenase [Alicyclobacillus ferrooxydans]|uniref:Glyceraldehyde-3-phosphate dehydrogenase n=1 Tax=Alicyclobacillus ferrooxydans TaxID=471514 RepID=A0A0P9CR11_9BACL|nr:type I glyceraldehyde-3-phosphate dehydrogenase [Alicyclobacillus ferrooxydans]KPV45303.1 glyceraldehyde-3-phosphate dehydrogenase [Alicyclobacillus ferrooxydans]